MKIKDITNYTNLKESILYPLSGKVGRGKYTLVTLSDVPAMINYSWSLSVQGYVRMMVGRKTINLARFLLKPKSSRIFTDHQNHNTLDNTRSNIRLATPSENKQNSQVKKDRYKGVAKRGKKYLSRIIKDGKLYRMIDLYDTAEDAAHAYDKMAKIIHGKFCCLNFPDDKLNKE